MSPPPPGVVLPPVDLTFVGLAPSASGGPTTVPSVASGFVRIRPMAAGSDAPWNFVCGDPWAGFDAAAANIVCRQAGFSAGGDIVRTWISGAMPPMLLGKLTCTGSEASLNQCAVSGLAGKVDYWQLNAPATASAGVCTTLAGVRCRDAAQSKTVNLRVATAPPPSNQTAGSTVIARLEASIGNGTYGAVCRDKGFDNSSATVSKTVNLRVATAPPPSNQTAGSTVIARLEASIGNGTYGAVCRDKGFDNSSATVVCRSLGFPAGGSVYLEGKVNAGDTLNDAAAAGGPVDAQGSYLGTLATLRCSGSEGGVQGCAAWRSTRTADVVPCRAAAWVACKTGASAPAALTSSH
ncbi:hypothetical protein GPECTOR_31g330 [Gonium pectorale]|uniref:SRCR domain-containing protein n=1 Tax=Gonium pectorale TaxID=33097 RepID=A0A150GDS3_GONPE|nr:hypothetical protein GPECTOR_31g330 [Gonium pectorale]|eukprot:KXZ47968.1 hypothetical protein GPECTOR_31g330 [Gonium pectorale]